VSAGPIKQWRDSWKPERVSTTNASRVCASCGGASYCGRRGAPVVPNWAQVTCADCLAARTADLEASGARNE